MFPALVHIAQQLNGDFVDPDNGIRFRDLRAI
jgi:hypothetical protein